MWFQVNSTPFYDRSPFNLNRFKFVGKSMIGGAEWKAVWTAAPRPWKLIKTGPMMHYLHYPFGLPAVQNTCSKFLGPFIEM